MFEGLNPEAPENKKVSKGFEKQKENLQAWLDEMEKKNAERKEEIKNRPSTPPEEPPPSLM